MHPDDVVAESVARGAEPVAVRAEVAGVRNVPRLNVLVQVGVVLGAVRALRALPEAQAFHHLPADLSVEICREKDLLAILYQLSKNVGYHYPPPS